jgi:hypothetical protein
VIGDVCLSAPYQNRNVDSPEGVSRQGIRNRATNYGCQDLPAQLPWPEPLGKFGGRDAQSIVPELFPVQEDLGVPAVGRSCVLPCSPSGSRNRHGDVVLFAARVRSRVALAWATFYSDRSSPEREGLV